jgi:hypothetical protein
MLAGLTSTNFFINPPKSVLIASNKGQEIQNPLGSPPYMSGLTPP